MKLAKTKEVEAKTGRNTGAATVLEFGMCIKRSRQTNSRQSQDNLRSALTAPDLQRKAAVPVVI